MTTRHEYTATVYYTPGYTHILSVSHAHIRYNLYTDNVCHYLYCYVMLCSTSPPSTQHNHILFIYVLHAITPLHNIVILFIILCLSCVALWLTPTTHTITICHCTYMLYIAHGSYIVILYVYYPCVQSKMLDAMLLLAYASL